MLTERQKLAFSRTRLRYIFYECDISVNSCMPKSLPRLRSSEYQGRSWIHWTMSMRDRGIGWLDDVMHAKMRELLIHAMSRYLLHCPAYCMMPDHCHFLWMGVCDESDQLRAARFLRLHWNKELKKRGHRLQPQAHDRVLRKEEIQPREFEDAAYYILLNPQRAKLVDDWKQWPYAGAVIPGYPDLPLNEGRNYWERFWKIHNRTTTRFKT